MNPAYRIRRCVDASDAEAIHALVVELAAFERKPDDVILTVADYRRHGFDASPPLFFASLAEFKKENEWIPVGVALWYFSFSSWEGKSFHLEDCMLIPSPSKHKHDCHCERS